MIHKLKPEYSIKEPGLYLGTLIGITVLPRTGAYYWTWSTDKGLKTTVTLKMNHFIGDKVWLMVAEPNGFLTELP